MWEMNWYIIKFSLRQASNMEKLSGSRKENILSTPFHPQSLVYIPWVGGEALSQEFLHKLKTKAAAKMSHVKIPSFLRNIPIKMIGTDD